jgi:hypothetical protein
MPSLLAGYRCISINGKRRSLITLPVAAAALPVAARAQQGERARRIGVLMSNVETDLEGLARVRALKRGLHKLGGSHIVIHYRWSRADVRVNGSPVHWRQRVLREGHHLAMLAVKLRALASVPRIK